MLIFTERLQSAPDNVVIETTLTLPYFLRQKSRLKVTLDNGVEAGLMLPRGPALRDGDLLRSEDKKIVRVRAADEPVSTIETNDQRLLARVCYHLGNRHVSLQIDSNGCRYLADHVLDEMVKSLGLTVKHESAPFEPEDGAYSQHSDHGHSYAHASASSHSSSAHAHSHSYSHSHNHNHD